MQIKHVLVQFPGFIALPGTRQSISVAVVHLRYEAGKTDDIVELRSCSAVISKEV